MKFAWGSGTGEGKQETSRERRGKGGHYTVGSPAMTAQLAVRVDTAVFLEREVVSGHAYAIPAPLPVRVVRADLTPT